jgi:hypothetical protein
MLALAFSLCAKFLQPQSMAEQQPHKILGFHIPERASGANSLGKRR